MMSRRRFGGSCCCGCYEAEDDFARAPSTYLGGNWVEQSGDWSINASEQLVGPTGDSQAIFQPSKTEYMIVSVWVVGGGQAGDIYKLYVQWKDASNYHHVEFALTATDVLTMTLYETIAGVETSLESCVGTWDSLDPVKLSACIGKHAFMAWSGYYPPIVTTDFTLIEGAMSGVGNDSARSITFDNYEYTEHYDSDVTCPNCGFCSCDEGLHTTPAVLQLTYIGYDEGCNDCSSLTGITVDLLPDSECNPIAWQAEEEDEESCFAPFEHPDFNPGDPWYFRWHVLCPLPPGFPEDLESWVLNMARYDRTPPGIGPFYTALCGLTSGAYGINVVPTIEESTCHPLVLVYNFDYYYCPPLEPHLPPPTPPNPESCSPPELDYPYNNICGDNACIDCGWTFPLGVCHRIRYKIIITEKA